jgi:hypothetical protein
MREMVPFVGDVLEFSDHIGWDGRWVVEESDHIAVDEDDTSGIFNWSFDEVNIRQLVAAVEYSPGAPSRRFRMNPHVIYGSIPGKALILEDDDLRVVGHMKKMVSISFEMVDAEE